MTPNLLERWQGNDTKQMIRFKLFYEDIKEHRIKEINQWLKVRERLEKSKAYIKAKRNLKKAQKELDKLSKDKSR